jgi:hypothetical protein
MIKKISIHGCVKIMAEVDAKNQYEKQCFGSGIQIRNRFQIQEGKNDPKKLKKLINLIF